MAIKPVGNNTTVSVTTNSASTAAIPQQTENIRVVAETVGCYVAIGTNPTATNANFYVSSTDAAEIAIGFPASQRVVGITTGTTTTIDFPEGTGSPFAVGEAVTLTATGQSNFDFSHKIVSSINNTSGVAGYHNTRIVVDHDSSSVTDTFDPDKWTQLRKSIKVAVKSEAGTGKAYIQQVQVS